MEAQKNIAEFQEKFVVPVPANIAKIVDERDRKILADSYLKLYSGFSWINWTNGHSLGRAWQTALTQCESFINTKKNNNPALKHLRNVFKSHKKYWSRVIMTHHDSENKISGNADWVAHMRAYGMQLIREAMDKINLILSRYNERIEELGMEQQNVQEHSAAHVQMSGAAIHIAGASNTANAEQNINGAQTAKVQTALTQCESFINTKKNNNPALKHLRNVFKSHKKYWSRVIMTHHDSENKISGNADWVAHMRAYGMQLIREAMDKINLILSRYNERIEELGMEQQNVQEHSAAHVQMSGAAIHIAGASNTANAEQNINGAQTAKVQSAGNTNAQPMNANTPVTEQPVIAQQATQSQPQQAVAQQQAIAQSTVAQQNTPAQAQKQSQQFALTEPVKAPQRAISANLHKQALAHATEKLKQLQPAIAKQKESALHNIAAQQVAKPQVQVAKPKPQLSGLVQNRTHPKPAIASVAKLQTQANIVSKVPHRPNMNMILFKNFNQRVA